MELNRRQLFASSVVGIISAATKTVNARCAMTNPRIVIVTPLDQPLPLGAAIVAREINGYSAASEPEQFPNPLVLRSGRSQIVLIQEAVSAGLYRLVPQQAPATNLVWTLQWGTTTHQVRFSGQPIAAPAMAPQITGLRVESVMGGYRSSMLVRSVLVMLGSPPPATARYLLTHWSPGANQLGLPVDLRASRAQEHTVWSNFAGRCVAFPRNLAVPTWNAPARFRFMDIFGQFSSSSDVQVPAG